MKQFTKEEAISFYDSCVWKGWSSEKIVRLQLFQDLMCVDFDLYHKSISHVLGRPVFSHEFAFHDQLVKEYLGVEQPPTFNEILDLIPENKKLLIFK